jgi:mRNA interferase HigB
MKDRRFGEPVEPRHRNRVISSKKIRVFCEEHPGRKDARQALDRWYKIAERAIWGNFGAVKATFNATDQVGKYLVFDVGGNKYRVVVGIFYEDRVILIRHILTHDEYDRDGRKSRLKQ